MLHADVAHALELFPGKDLAHGVVGVAEDEHLHIVVDDLALKVLEVDLKVGVHPLEGGFYQLAAIGADAVGEGIVEGGLDQNALAGLGESENGPSLRR